MLGPMSRLRLIQFLMGFLFLYLLFMSFEIPFVFKSGFGSESSGGGGSTVFVLPQHTTTDGEDDPPPINRVSPPRIRREYKNVSGLVFDDTSFDSIKKDDFSELHKSARDAFVLGKKVWEEISIGSGKVSPELQTESVNRTESPLCPVSVSMLGAGFLKLGRVMMIPCGLTLGSHITIVGKPKRSHPERETKISLLKEDQSVMVSQFMMELQGLKVVDGEDPPRILHFNPRLKGDWSGRPVIEQNTCYRMQWGSAMRCEGWKSKPEDETVDGQVKCEKWNRDDDNGSEESKAIWWLSRLIGRTKKVIVNWPYPFAEGKLFVLTLSAGLEGYHINVDGRHVTSFPYRPGFTLEDATGLSLKGDVEVRSIFAASLPTSNPNFAPMGHLEMVAKWRAPPLPDGPLQIFIGILSSGNHFAERMAARKSWMQHRLIRSAIVVARFFVALHGRKEVNLQLMEEAKYFGDIVMVPYMDNYDLVVLKTVAICEYGVRTAAANYIMKCDDDTFVRVDAVMMEVKKVPHDRSLYVGNINYYHKPLRNGKWAVTYEEWPEEYYPPYANGPGYVVSSDIAQYTVSEFERHKLRLFKMEDVSMGMWVENFNRTRAVEYIHSLKFCQFGCIEDYLTAHYQSPRQMICLWGKLQQGGKARCCDTR